MQERRSDRETLQQSYLVIVALAVVAQEGTVRGYQANEHDRHQAVAQYRSAQEEEPTTSVRKSSRLDPALYLPASVLPPMLWSRRWINLSGTATQKQRRQCTRSSWK